MKCIEFEELMQRQLDHDLSEQEAAKLNAHLSKCGTCTVVYQQLTALHHELESLPHVTPPFSLVDRILPQLLEQSTTETSTAPPLAAPIEQSKRKRMNWRPWTAGGIAAAALVGIIWTQSVIAPAPMDMLEESAGALMAPSNASEDQRTMELEMSSDDMGIMDVSGESPEMQMASESAPDDGVTAEDSKSLPAGEFVQAYSPDQSVRAIWQDNRVMIIDDADNIVARSVVSFAGASRVEFDWLNNEELIYMIEAEGVLQKRRYHWLDNTDEAIE